MNKLQMLLTIGMSCLLLAAGACFQAGEEEARITEPCVPLPGSDVDPCERQPHWSVRTNVSGSYRDSDLPTIPYVLLNELRRIMERAPHGLWTPQFFVRGTFIPDSSRCILPGASMRILDDGQLVSYNYLTTTTDYVRYACFTDVLAHEYLNGSGPSRLPIVTWQHYVSRQEATAEHIASFKNHSPMKWLEGREMMFYVVRPGNINDVAWDYSGFVDFWDVQRREDGEVVVVAGWADVDHRFDYEFTLDEFRAEARAAMAAFREGTGGRVGDDPNEKMLARDANLGTLLENLRTYGAYSVADITPVVAPTVPGETDPDPYGLMVSDAVPPASPVVPGGLEDMPTPVSVLGDEPTAVATAPTPESEVAGE